jgi:hypothetical protein
VHAQEVSVSIQHAGFAPNQSVEAAQGHCRSTGGTWRLDRSGQAADCNGVVLELAQGRVFSVSWVLANGGTAAQIIEALDSSYETLRSIFGREPDASDTQNTPSASEFGDRRLVCAAESPRGVYWDLWNHPGNHVIISLARQIDESLEQQVGRQGQTRTLRVSVVTTRS